MSWEVVREYYSDEEPNFSATEEVGQIANTPNINELLNASLGKAQENRNRSMAVATGINRSGDALARGVTDPIARLLGADEYLQKSRQQKALSDLDYQRSMEQHPYATAAGEIGMDILSAIPPTMAGTAGVARFAPKAYPWIQRALGSGIGMAALGGVAEPGSDGSRSKNALVEGLMGLGGGFLAEALPPLGRGARSAVRGGISESGGKETITRDMANRLLPGELQEGREVMDAAKELGLHLTPAEATGNTSLASLEGALGSTTEAQKSLSGLKSAGKNRQKEIVEGFFDEVSPSGDSFAEEARELAKNIIKRKEKALAKDARPFYQAAEGTRIGEIKYDQNLKPFNPELDRLLKDSNIKRAYDYVTNSSTYESELEGFAPDSIKVLDLVKRHLYDMESSAGNAGQNNKARIYGKARDNLVRSLDKASPVYKDARAIYEMGSPEIDKLRKGGLMGKIANLEDINAETIGQKIFNPKTNQKSLERMRDEMYAADPDIWNGIVRNEMERRVLGSKNLGKTDNYGSEFFNLVSRDRDMKMLETALENSPEQLEKLRSMKKAFKNLINERTVKGNAGRAENSMNMPRSDVQGVMKMLRKATGGKYDEAAIDIISNPEWTEEFGRALAEQAGANRNNAVLQLLDKVSKISGKAASESPRAVAATAGQQIQRRD